MKGSMGKRLRNMKKFGATPNPLTETEKQEIKNWANVQYGISQRYQGIAPIKSSFYRGRSIGMGKIAQSYNPTSKEPWEMTREEFNKQGVKPFGTEPIEITMQAQRKGAGAFSVNFGKLGKRFLTQQDTKDYVRRLVIERAIKEGKPVPPEVLADYPGLRRMGKVAQSYNPTGMTYELEKVAMDDIRKYGSIAAVHYLTRIGYRRYLDPLLPIRSRDFKTRFVKGFFTATKSNRNPTGSFYGTCPYCEAKLSLGTGGWIVKCPRCDKKLPKPSCELCRAGKEVYRYQRLGGWFCRDCAAKLRQRGKNPIVESLGMAVVSGLGLGVGFKGVEIASKKLGISNLRNPVKDRRNPRMRYPHCGRFMRWEPTIRGGAGRYYCKYCGATFRPYLIKRQ